MKRLLILILFIPVMVMGKHELGKDEYNFLASYFASLVENDSTVIYVQDQPNFKYITDRVSLSKKEDSSHVSKKVKDYRNFYLNMVDIPHVKFVPTKKFRKIFKKYDVEEGWSHVRSDLKIPHGYYSVSIPIFFDNGNKVLFYNDHNSGGLCGSGSLVIYEKRNGGWVLTDTLLRWMS